MGKSQVVFNVDCISKFKIQRWLLRKDENSSNPGTAAFF